MNRTYNKRQEIDLYVHQAEDISIAFNDTGASTDFSTLSAVTFDVWDSITTGSTNRITKSLSSGISITDTDTITVVLTSTNTNIAAQRYRFELWVTTASGTQHLLRDGDFVVEDTRKYD